MNENKEYFVNEEDFIVSKTDLKGRITYCNQPFLKIVGATQEQLLHKPHNIIRHPNMPRIVFKLLWERIKAKQEIFAFVKNKSFDGGFYWVFANITASLDATARSSATTPFAASQTQMASNLLRAYISSCLRPKKAAAWRLLASCWGKFYPMRVSATTS